MKYPLFKIVFFLIIGIYIEINYHLFQIEIYLFYLFAFLTIFFSELILKNTSFTKNERTNSDLSDWSNQGVLLLNSILSVRRKFPGSHRHIGWEEFTENVIIIISKEKMNLVFMLWGNYAKNKEK